MVFTHQVHIFISHSWNYSEHYSTLRKWIFDSSWQTPSQTNLVFHDRSVPKDEPIDADPNSLHLDFAIFGRIYTSNVVVIPTGMYANHSTWIQREIDFARAMAKPILGVNLRGHKRHSSVVANASTAIAKWNRQSIVREIWKCYTTSTVAYR